MDFSPLNIEYDTTVEELVSTPLALFAGFKNNTTALLNYSTAEGDPPVNVTNFDRIVREYNKKDLQTESAKITTRQLTLIKANTKLALPKSAQDLELAMITGKNLFVKDIASFSAYYGTYLNLLKLDGFVPSFPPYNFRSPTYSNVTVENSIDIRQYNISVWVWSRAYSKNGTDLLDISKYVENCTINVNGVQNSFSLSLQAVNDKAFPVGDEDINRIDIDTDNKSASVWDFVQPATSISERLPIPWFKKILQQNDIFFIRYEQLKLEKTEDRVASGIKVPASMLPGKVYDMIGLVDRVSSNFNATINDLSVDVSGRDFTKLLIEDGSYFFPLLFTENSDALFFNTQDDGKWFKRTFVK
jgi:hypothetical protein